MKKVLIGIILGGIIFCSSIGIYAASYMANDISYTPTDNSWKVSNVNDALDSLYKSSNNSNHNITKYSNITSVAVNGWEERSFDLSTIPNIESMVLFENIFPITIALNSSKPVYDVEWSLNGSVLMVTSSGGVPMTIDLYVVN